MSELKLVWHYNGKLGEGTSHAVTAREMCGTLLSDALSPTNIVGVGSDFGSARADFADKLDEYINELIKFRDDVVNTRRAYYETIRTDCCWNPLSKR